MGTRFLAVLAVVALGAGSAMVGMTMAQGSWNTLGVGLEPGAAYAVQLTGQADRLKLELAEGASDAVASFSVYTPSGARAGYYTVDTSSRVAEVVATQGIWTVFVYKAMGADLNLAVHGATDSGRLLPAEVLRKETQLGHIPSTQPIDQTYTAVLEKEPVLAGVYLKGSARNLQSELRTEKGIVELVNEQQVAAAAAGVIVDASSQRNTMPGNLQAGPFTAKVTAESISGQLILVALYIDAPTFDEPEEPEVAPPGKPPRAPKPPGEHREWKHKHEHKAHVKPRVAEDFAVCGTIDSRVPAALEIGRGAVLRLSVEEGSEAWVTLYDPLDQVLAHLPVAVEEDEDDDGGFSTGRERQKEKEHKEAIAAITMLPMAGEYVLYSRGASVQVALQGIAECELRELGVEAVGVAYASLRGMDREGEALPFNLAVVPLELGIRVASPDAVAWNIEARFTSPAGEVGAASDHMTVGLLRQGFDGFLPFMGHQRWGGSHDSMAYDLELDNLVPGDWTVEVQGEFTNGDFEAYVLQFVRDHEVEEEDDGN